jgi:hypothetical protein
MKLILPKILLHDHLFIELSIENPTTFYNLRQFILKGQILIFYRETPKLLSHETDEYLLFF